MTTVIAIDDIESFFSHAEGAAKAELKMFLDDFNDSVGHDFAGFFKDVINETIIYHDVEFQMAVFTEKNFVKLLTKREDYDFIIQIGHNGRFLHIAQKFNDQRCISWDETFYPLTDVEQALTSTVLNSSEGSLPYFGIFNFFVKTIA